MDEAASNIDQQPIVPANATPTEPIAVTQRIVTDFYAAKRMLHALSMTI